MTPFFQIPSLILSENMISILEDLPTFMNFQMISFSRIMKILSFITKKTTMCLKYEDKANEKKQISWMKNSFLIKDDIVLWKENEIPLWLFGLIQ